MNRLFFLSKVLVFGTAFILISSCEKVIEVQIDNEEQVYVFEGVLKDRDSTSFFKVSKTVGIYDQMSNQVVSGASIMVQDANMSSWTFTEDVSELGTYRNFNFSAVENMTYSLSASVDGNLITSTSFSKRKPILDSIYARPNPLHPGQPQSNWIFYHSTDYVDETNYYRLRIWVNGDEPSQYYIGNDFYINGETYEAQFFTADAFPGDTVLVEMLEMDEDVYDYIYGLSNTLTTGAFSPAPANPPSNLNSQVRVLGYFGVYMTQVDSIIVP
jgi:Domain of unknown function (DUF4249)